MAGKTYAYNDGDGTTALRRRVSDPDRLLRPRLPRRELQRSAAAFRDMRDRYFLLNGRGYPDTVNPALSDRGSD